MSLVGVVTAYPRYFEALRAHGLALTPSHPSFGVVSGNYARLKALYPRAFFPPVTLLYGRYNPG